MLASVLVYDIVNVTKVDNFQCLCKKITLTMMKPCRSAGDGKNFSLFGIGSVYNISAPQAC